MKYQFLQSYLFSIPFYYYPLTLENFENILNPPFYYYYLPILRFFQKILPTPVITPAYNKVQESNDRSCSQIFFKIGVLELSLQLRLQHSCVFQWSCKIFQNSFFTEHLRWLLL